MDRPVIVIGAGGHAKVVIDVLLKQGVRIIGVVDSDSDKAGAVILGVKIIGDDDAIFRYATDEIYLVNGIGSVGKTNLRKNIFMKFEKHGYKFAVIIHPSAVLGTDIKIEEGAQIMAGAVVQTGVTIGRNVIVNTRASIDHDCVIKSHVHISPGVTICGDVVVGEGTHVGAGSIIIQGIEIGEDVLVGAGTLVLKNVAKDKRIYGSPAKEVKV